MKEKVKKILESTGLFKQQLENINNDNCPTCGLPIDLTGFRDELSKKEHEISGMCQKCQDDIFGR